MPYYIYKISPGPTDLVKNLEAVQELASYSDAKKRIRELRAQGLSDKDSVLKMVFADNRLHAEELLSEKREKPVLQEWEK